jgi:hypothetical protein
MSFLAIIGSHPCQQVELGEGHFRIKPTRPPDMANWAPACLVGGFCIRIYRVKRASMVYKQTQASHAWCVQLSYTSNSKRQRRVRRSHTAALLVCADQRPRVAIKYRLQSRAEYTSTSGSICDAANCHSRELLSDIALAAGKKRHLSVPSAKY